LSVTSIMPFLLIHWLNSSFGTSIIDGSYPALSHSALGLCEGYRRLYSGISFRNVNLPELSVALQQ
jgi:hypothetical protein